jgi:hypothetical protein
MQNSKFFLHWCQLETHFLWYCKQNAEEGTWAIVDFPVDSLQQNFQNSYAKYWAIVDLLVMSFKICQMAIQGYKISLIFNAL